MTRGKRLTVKEALERLPASGGLRFAKLFEHGTLEVEIYAPRGRDPQQPHLRDEVYVVAMGSGVFLCDGERERFGPGDFLFVPAGVEHRFEVFTADMVV
jgi:mannose-6-phosphate isomerase-like protein (cupin superfamily)